MKNNKKINLRFNIVAILLLVLFAFAISPVTMQNDTYYTIKIGEHILNNGIDMQDPFSWHINLPYTYPHWLYDVMMYGIYSVTGFTGIYISTISFASILGVLIYFINKKLCKNEVISLIISLTTMYLLKDFIAARAQLVTFILFAFTILFIEKFVETRKIRNAIPLVVIPIIIANVHSAVWPFYFILFIPYIVECILEILIKLDLFTKGRLVLNKILLNLVKNKEKIESKQKNIRKKIEDNKINLENKRNNPYKLKIEKNKGAKWLIVILIFAILTGLCTPLGDVPYTYLVKTMQGNTTENINEHLPITLIDNKEALVTLSMFLAILIFTDTKIKLRDICMMSGLIILTLMSRRQVSMLYLIGNFIFAKLIVQMFQKYFTKIFSKIEKILKGFIGQIITVLLIGGLCVFLLIPKLDDKFIDESEYPAEACTFILNNLDLNNVKLYNEYNYGSYLIYRGIPVFIDSRADLYSPEFNGIKNEEGELEGRDIFTDFLDISSIATYYENKFEEYGITHAMMGKNTKLNMLISRDKNYRLIYNDKNFVIYERKSENPQIDEEGEVLY